MTKLLWPKRNRIPYRSYTLTLLTAGRRAAGASVLLCLTAIVLYPGGRLHQMQAGRYSFFKNFLSDLGRRVTLGGGDNRFGSQVFFTSVILFVLGLSACLLGLIRLHRFAPPARRWANVAGIAVALAGISLIAVAFTPLDKSFRVHVALTNIAVNVLPAVSILLGIAAQRDQRFPRRSAVAWMLLSALLVFYLLVITWGPGLGSERGLAIHVTGQKIVVLATLIVISYQSWLAEKYL